MKLPSLLARVLDRVIELSTLEDADARQARADLEEHMLDGLDAGHTPDEVLRRFGRPEDVAAALSEGAPPPPPPLSPRRRESFWRSWVRDVRFSVRVLARTPALSVTAILVVALGLAATTVVFTVVNEALLRPLPVQDPETLVDVWPDVPGGNSFLGFSYLDYQEYRTASAALTDLAAFAGTQLSLGEEPSAETVIGQLITPNYFEMLGLSASFGRLSFPADGVFGGELEAVISYAFWQNDLGGSRDVLGTTLLLDGHQATIIGVGPEGFSGHFIGFPLDLWLPLTAADPLLAGFDPSDPARKPFEMIGRAQPGRSAGAVQAALNQVAEGLERRYPEHNRGHRVGVTPTTGLDHSLRAGTLAFLGILAAVSGLALLIACFNVGALVLVRTMSRDREMAIRLAIGAGTGRLVRQILTESFLLVLGGALLGTLVAVQVNGFLSDLVRTLSGGLGLELGLDLRVLALTGLATLVAALVAGGGPALYLLKKQPASALRARGGAARVGTRLRTGLVLGQVAVSVVLVTVTGLFVRALADGASADPGFAATQVASFPLSLADWEDDPAEGAARLDQVVLELGRLPDVTGVAVSTMPIPGVARSPTPLQIAGVLPEPGQDQVITDGIRVGAGVATVLGIPVLQGRDLESLDIRDGSSAALVSRAFQERFWPGQNALGQTFMAGGREVTVVGVLADARYLLQDDSPDPLLYLARDPVVMMRPVVTVRSAAPLALAGAVNQVVSRVVPGHPTVRLRSGRDRLDDALLPQRIGSLIVGALGIAALFLAAVGLYGLLQFTVTRDRQEFGVRLALGARGGDLMRIVVRKGLALVGIGVAVGVGLALLVAPSLRGFLIGISPLDPLTYGVVLVSFTVVAVLASVMPAWRAIRIAPAEALRED